ncbi:solute carrier family 22 member 5-like [Gymnodraco acuticeps]|uniref:Solute carrier family 22 member 5-like n=1 Tax=Gymnodraco acuticeps TaxID=8218 RepID=A0A6P8TES5_GYMAC|nr:solute carrier family 22 member 5-like [Gymnodraco acuticeps]
MKDYDESTAFLGQWGRFQQVVFFLLCASIVPNGVGVFSVVFLTDIPRHHCLIPEENLTQDWRDAIIPIEVWEEGGCFHLSRGPECGSHASVLLSFMADVLHHVPLCRSFPDFPLYFCVCARNGGFQ